MSVSLFLLGLGWNLSYVAAATELADRALPAERGKLIGFSDLLSSFTGPPSRSSAASPTASSESRRSPSARPPSWPCPRPGFCYDPPPAHPMCALFC